MSMRVAGEAMATRPVAAVAEAFAASAVCPTTADQIRSCTYWTQEGLRLLDEVTLRVGRERWRTATAALAPVWSVADQARVLGLGAAMYRYIAAPLAAPPGPKAAIIAGALTQLTVGLYDHLLDERLLDQPLDVGH